MLEPIVYVVDDDEAMRDSLRWLIESVDLPVQTYPSADRFLEAVMPERPGCLVLDVRMPGMSGLDLQERLAERGSILPVILLTGHADVPMAVRAMRRGAFDFIEKPFNDQVLLDRIQEGVRAGMRSFSQRREEQALRAKLQSLTPREHQVLDLVVAGSSNKGIARELGISLKTVEVHRHNVMEKMGAHCVADLVQMLFLARPAPQGKP